MKINTTNLSIQEHVKGIYRPDIDGLRALAIIPVVLFHAFPKSVPGGFIGVDVFFIISGYLISFIIFNGVEKNTFRYSDFYIRRILRIFPSLIAVLLFCSLIGWLALLPEEFALLGKYISGGAFFIDNFVALGDAGYFDKNTELKPLVHLWSLGIEEQFYLFWPLIILLSNSLRIKISILLLVLIALSFGFNLHEISQNPMDAFYTPWARMWELLLGGLLAYIFLRKSKENLTQSNNLFSSYSFASKSINNVCSCIGAVLLLYGIFFFNRNTIFPGVNALVPVLGALLLIGAGKDAIINKFILSNKIIIFFGVISYPLYLWHWTLLSFLRVMVGVEPTALPKIVTIIIAIIFSWLTYVYIENPIRFGGSRIAKTVSLSFALSVCGIFGYITYVNQGYPGHRESIDLINYVKEVDEGCKKLYPISNRYCRIGEGEKPASVVLLGDSHANRLFEPLSGLYKGINENLLQIGEAGCLPLYDVQTTLVKSPTDCYGLVGPELDYILNDKRIKTVLLAFYGRYYLQGTNSDRPEEVVVNISDVKNPKNRDRVKIYEAGLQKTIQRFIENGKKVILFIDVPDYPYDPKICIGYDRPFNSIFLEKKSCQIQLDEVSREDSGYVNATYDVANKMDIKVVNLRDALCWDGVCHAIKDGILLYRDRDHLNPTGSTLVINKLWPIIKK